MHPKGLDHLLTRFEAEYLDVHNISPGRRKEQLVLLRKFAATLGGRGLTTLTPSDLSAFLGAEMKAGLHPNTGAKHLSMIRSFVFWAHEAGLVALTRRAELTLVRNPRGATTRTRPNPYKSHEIPVLYDRLSEKFPPMPLSGRRSQLLKAYLRRRAAGDTTAQMRHALWRHAKRLQYEAQIALALEAGLRRVEIHSLTVPAIDPSSEEIVVLTAKQGPGREIKRGIPYPPHARIVIAQWLDFRHLLEPDHNSPWLTLNHNGGYDQLAPVSLITLGKSLHDDLGPPWRWHRLRHTAATEWLRAGVPLEKVRVFMGHANIEQTLAYAELLKTDIADAFGKANASFAERLRLPMPPPDEEAAA